MIVKRSECLLCRVQLESDPQRKIQIHPEIETCNVKFTDEWGIALTSDEVGSLEAGNDGNEVQAIGDLDGLLLQQYPTVESVIVDLFKEHDLPRLGGQSTGRGWSSVSLWQRCRYAWRKRYVDQVAPIYFSERESLAVGTLVHLFLALHYVSQIDDIFMSLYRKLTPEVANEYLLNRANPTFINEAWRIFKAYRLFYQDEEIIPLAVEYDLKDPRTDDSCRYDLIAYFPNELNGRPPGTYNIEHKTAQRFDLDTIEGWANDGEVIGQGALWKRLGLDNRFGKLQGTIVNILGKQKEPKFHRTIVSSTPMLVESHRSDLKRWEGEIQLARATGNFPRSRANCISRYGRCEWWEHCVSGES